MIKISKDFYVNVVKQDEFEYMLLIFHQEGARKFEVHTLDKEGIKKLRTT